MKVKLILPALTEAMAPHFRPIKYSLFPPLGLATLAAYLDDADEVTLHDEHVQRLNLNDDPDLVVIEAYVTSARRAYAIADHYRRRGAHVCIGGLHVTSMPQEAARWADTIFLGPGEDTWPRFLTDLRAGRARKVYRSTVRTLEGAPAPRRDLIQRHRYLIPNSIVVSRGCPHHCSFCYKHSFFAGGASHYTLSVDSALAQIADLPGRHLFFLDDNLFADEAFAHRLFAGLRGMGRLWQAAATVKAALQPGLLERAVDCGLRSLFVGFESVNSDNLRRIGKPQQQHRQNDRAAIRLHDLGVMINASFVFGLDGDDPDVFDRTVDWAVRRGIETATFHIMTPYPGTAIHQQLAAQKRILTRNWDLYDTRHAVFRPARMSVRQLEHGYWHAYERFYSWENLLASARTRNDVVAQLRQLVYAGGWKKCEFAWNAVIKLGLLRWMQPVLEKVLSRRVPARAAVNQAGSGSSGSTGEEPGPVIQQELAEVLADV